MSLSNTVLLKCSKDTRFHDSKTASILRALWAERNDLQKSHQNSIIMTMPKGDKKTSKTSGITNDIIPSFKAGNQGLQQNKENQSYQKI